MRLIGKPMSESVGDILRRIIEGEDVSEAYIAVAYIKKEGYELLRKLSSKASTRLIVCLGAPNIEYYVLRDILDAGTIKCRYLCLGCSNNLRLHAKLYIFKHSDNRFSVIIGSSNLTRGGVYDNVEANLYFEKISREEAHDFIEFFNAVWSQGCVLDENAVENFVRHKDEYIRIVRRYKKESMKKKETETASDMGAEELLRPANIDRLARILGREKKGYEKTLQETEYRECIERREHMEKVKSYAEKEDWVNMFREIWSVYGLLRSPLARYGKKGLPEYIVKANGADAIRRWIRYVKIGDWKKAYKNKPLHIGESIQSEVFAIYHGESFGIKNNVSKKALEYLLGENADSFGYKNFDSMPYLYFNDILKEIGYYYEKIIGRKCDNIPLMIELDMFLWYIYKNTLNKR